MSRRWRRVERQQTTQRASITLTGWFSDEACAAPRVASGNIGPTNPECSRRYIEKGKPAVFISQEQKRLLRVRSYGAAKDDLGYRVEVTGTIDESAKTISAQTVKRLEYQGASCARPSAKRKLLDTQSER